MTGIHKPIQQTWTDFLQLRHCAECLMLSATETFLSGLVLPNIIPARHKSNLAARPHWPRLRQKPFLDHFNSNWSVQNGGHDHGFAKALEVWDDGSHNGWGHHQPDGSRCPARQDPLGTLAHDLIHEGNVVRPRCSHHLERIADLRAVPASAWRSSNCSSHIKLHGATWCHMMSHECRAVVTW